jgi:hypothetical protein
MRRLAAAVVMMALAASATLSALHAQRSPLRTVDWRSVIATDPHVTLESGPVTRDPNAFGPALTVTLGNATASGAPVLEEVTYADLDGDGAEEAVLPLFSTGAAGRYTGYMLFHEDDPGPRLLAVEGGPNVIARVVDGTLVVTHSIYAGFEGFCCPSAGRIVTNVLTADGLMEVSEQEVPYPVQGLTVSAFYGYLGAHDFATAWKFLSPELQASFGGYDAWVAAYATTVSVSADVKDTDDPDTAYVQINAVDLTADGGTATSHFAGTWHLSYSYAQHRWLLDAAEIART